MQILRSQNKSDNVSVSRPYGVAASQTIAIGDLLQLNGTSKLLEAAVAASTTIAGIAEQAITTTASPALTDVCSITLVRGEVVRMPFTAAGTKKTMATTDKFLTAFDLLDKNTLAPDDTTGGMCYVQGYDNTNLTVDVIFAAANLANIG
jgi:hypothetical protein